MAPALKLPDVVKFRPELWNSRPLDVDYLQTIFAKKFYYTMCDNECRITLINLLTVLSRFREVFEGETQELMRESISSMICALAVNIRIDPETVLLSETDGRPETRLDVPIGDGLDTPISFRQHLSTEVRDATRKVVHFDIIGPALAWAAIQYLVGVRQRTSPTDSDVPERPATSPTSASVHAVLDEAVRSEFERFRRMGIELAMPRGCLHILEKSLPRLGAGGLRPADAATLVKTVAVYFKHTPAGRDRPEVRMFRRQLERFTRVFIADSLGPWTIVDDITNSEDDRVEALIESLEESCTPAVLRDRPNLAEGLDTLRRFRAFIADRKLSFARDSYMTYSVYETGMLSYLDSKLASNRALVDCLKRTKDRLREIREAELAESRRSVTASCDSDGNKPDVDAEILLDTKSDGTNESSNNKSEDIDRRLAGTVANLYNSKMKSNCHEPADGDHWRYDDFWTNCQSLTDASSQNSASGKKRRRRNRRR